MKSLEIAKKIAKRDGDFCGECGFKLLKWEKSAELKLPYDAITLDHIVPKSAGGTNKQSNLRIVHSICNYARHSDNPKVLFRKLQFVNLCLTNNIPKISPKKIPSYNKFPKFSKIFRIWKLFFLFQISIFWQ